MQARNAADRHLTETLDPATRAAIFTTSGQGNVDFTDDRAKLHEALAEADAAAHLGSAGVGECPDLTYYMADLIQNKNDQTASAGRGHRSAGHLRSAAARSAQRSKLSANDAAGDTRCRKRLARATASRVLGLGERETRLAFTVLGERHPADGRRPGRP